MKRTFNRGSSAAGAGSHPTLAGGGGLGLDSLSWQEAPEGPASPAAKQPCFSPAPLFASLASNEFCRVAGSPGQAFPPPVLSSQGTAGDGGGGGFPVFPSQARGRRKPRGCSKRTCGGAAFGELSGCQRAGGGAAALFLWEGASQKHMGSPRVCPVCASSWDSKAALRGGGSRTGTHPAGKGGGCKPGVLGGATAGTGVPSVLEEGGVARHGVQEGGGCPPSRNPSCRSCSCN